MASGQWLVASPESRAPSPESPASNPSPLTTSHWPLATNSPLSTIHYPLSTASSRHGISLLEVLFSIGILTVGLFGVAALIPLGKLAMMETEKSDRTGACGRAALREIKVRRMLDYRYWVAPTPPTWWNAVTQYNDAPPLVGLLQPFVIDPLGVTSSITVNLGNGTSAIPRVNLNYLTTFNQADTIFGWNDDLIFTLPEDMSPPGTGERPEAMYEKQGNFSWFLTVAPASSEATLAVANKRLYSVAVAVCHKRILTQTSGQPDGERMIPTALADTFTCTSPGYGGTTVTFVGPDLISGEPPLKKNEWILLYSTDTASSLIVQATWYRVVHAGYDTNSTTNYITLVGPDWHGGTAAKIVVVGGVTGVYTTTVQLDSDLIWNQ